MLAELFTFVVSHADLTTGLLFVVVALVTWHLYNDHNLPPGPWGLPVVGYLPFVKSEFPERVFDQLNKKYGNVMSVRLGSSLVVVLGNYEAIREAYVKQGDNFAGRPKLLMSIRQDDGGLMITDGDIWKDHRRFALSTLRDYGMGKLSLEPRIMEEIHCFLDCLAKKNGQPYNFSHMLGVSSANIICTLEFGRRFEYDDARFVELRRLIDEMFELFGSVPIRSFFPYLTNIPLFEPLTKQKRLIQIDDAIKKFINEIVDEHERDYNDDSQHDYIDAYITERSSIKNKTGSEGYFTHKELVGTLQGLFNAGTEATSTTISWAIMEFLLHPEMQEKVQKEIDDVIGMERAPTMADRTKMPFTDAFLMEVQRFGSLAGVAVFHSNLEEDHLFGYRIPKRTTILSNLWAVHFDPTLWKEPEKFTPERFINEKGEVQKSEYLIPFGVGKRSCLGESLAKMEVFLYFTSMAQRFTFLPAEDGVEPKLVVESGAIRRPKAYKMRAVQRKGYHVTY